MPLNRVVSVLTEGVTPKQVKRAGRELNARVVALMTWDKVSSSLGGKFDRSYLWQVAMDKRKPSRRLLRALGIIKSERRTGVRIRLSLSDAREIVEYNTVPIDVVNRIRYLMQGAK